MDNISWKPADILLPVPEVDLEQYSVVACDQYTSEPDYWERVFKTVSHHISTYFMIFPEIDLKKEGFNERIDHIHQTMTRYENDHVFRCYPNSFIYLERQLHNGAVRRGVVGMIDLEQYDYRSGSQSLIRATEGTVLERIPPRMQIRQNALLELPHIMLLVDDPSCSVIEPLGEKTEQMEMLYDFDLMEHSGHLTGWKLDAESADQMVSRLESFKDPEAFYQKYGVSQGNPMLFAVGDGNHSLASAKACYEALKQQLSPEEAAHHPARYALVELVNLHDASLTFEAIHRVVFGIDPAHLVKQLESYAQDIAKEKSNVQQFQMVIGEKIRELYFPNPTSDLTVGTLQQFLDQYVSKYGGEIDYIHGEDVVFRLCGEASDRVGFILPCMKKSDLFRAVILDGALPRKTFSMGEACDKRFYLEARKIR
jgi:uncharacterized protein (DUF1015 family)